MDTKYEIVKYSPEFKSQIVELQTHLWSSDVSLNTAYFEWKHERNPYVDTPLIYVALCAGKVVGMRGMFGAEWRIGDSGQTFLGPCSGDSVIAPEHRNRGIFRKLIMAHLNDLANSRYIYTFALSANPTTRVSLLTMGWRSIGNLQTMIWKARHRIILHRLQSYVARLSSLPSSKKLNPFHFLDQNAMKRQDKVSPFVSVEQTPRPEAMAELVKRTLCDGRIRHVRDQEYFSWRFNNPFSRYRFLFWEESRLEGYLILQTEFNNNTLRASIVDWEATNPEVRSNLLEVALRLGNFDALSIWTATLPKAVKVLLEKNGFRLLSEPKSKRQYRPTVLVRPVRDDALKADWIIGDRRLLDLANWDLRMINSDGS
jgi:GNAT superfamily N-acetyltransferase